MPLGQTRSARRALPLVLTACRQKQKSICPALAEATAEMAEEEGPCEWEGELDDGFPTGQVSHPTRSTPNTRVSTFTPPARE
jgi:hypothetical protein